MPADSASTVDEEVNAASSKAKQAAKAAVADATELGQKRLNEAIDIAERNIREAAKRVEAAVRESVETLRTRAEPYRENATAQLDEAQKYVVERIRERPVVATLAGLGAGLLIGLLLANRSEK
ncbi:MAG TPA: hypothetical protein VMT68_00775 [Caulobacteraceae bacterium]|nr:hypothetical protein [Caulobacteraceae bacterium]